MNSFAAILAPLALLLPGVSGGVVGGVAGIAADTDAAKKPGETAALTPDLGAQSAGQPAASSSAPGWRFISDSLRIPKQSQVSIERRLTIRISPSRGPVRSNLLATLPPQELEKRYDAKKMGKCVPLGAIAGVQVDRENRLLLFMADRRIVRANLDKKCNARDFYSGFYVERNKDGKLCISRDDLRSRVGSSCRVKSFRRMVPAA